MKIEVIHQAQESECGLACLAMIARRSGIDLTLRDLRERYPVSQRGTTLFRISEIADGLGFETRALRLGLDAIQKLAVPCILHWDLNHFVVLERAKTRGITVVDPARGRRFVPFREVNSRFTGIALELVPPRSASGALPASGFRLRDTWGRMRGLGRLLTLIGAASLCIQLLVLVSPFYVQWIVDQVLVSGQQELLVVLGVGFCLLVVVQVAAYAIRGWTISYLSTEIARKWGSSLFRHMMKLPIDFYEKRKLGDIVSRFGSLQAIQRTMTTSSVEVVLDGLIAATTIAMMFFYSQMLALVSLTFVLCYLALRVLAFPVFRSKALDHVESQAAQQGHFLESMRGIQTIRVTGTEHLRVSTYSARCDSVAEKEFRVARLNLWFASGGQMIFGLERVVVVWLAARLTLAGDFTIGMLMAYVGYKEMFATRSAALVDKLMEFRLLGLHVERIADIAMTPAKRRHTSFGSFGADNSIEVRGVSYSYASDGDKILRECSFDVASGESVVIVGASGSGKTTLLKLMLGLLRPDSGTIRIGGALVTSDVDSGKLPIATVMQEDKLFSGSIAENIAFGDDQIDLDRVVEAARQAFIHGEIVSMPMGYYSLIGDLGSTLSGGQKQRVLIARALYRKPSVLFLDEATSHLDAKSERAVNECIGNSGITRVVIAHRRETIASADRVIVLKDGRIEETFNPAERIKRAVPGARAAPNGSLSVGADHV